MFLLSFNGFGLFFLLLWFQEPVLTQVYFVVSVCQHRYEKQKAFCFYFVISIWLLKFFYEGVFFVMCRAVILVIRKEIKIRSPGCIVLKILLFYEAVKTKPNCQVIKKLLTTSKLSSWYSPIWHTFINKIQKICDSVLTAKYSQNKNFF